MAESYHNIGSFYANNGDRKNALTYLSEAKAIRVKKLGADHPHTKETIAAINELK